MAEKNQAPTSRRLREARKRGEVVLSADVVSALSFVGVLAALWLLGPSFFGLLQALMDHALRGTTLARPEAELVLVLGHAEWALLLVLTTIAAVMAIFGVAGAFAQVGGLMAWQRLKPDLKRINPAEGLKRIMSLRNLVNLVKTVVKTVLLGALMYFVVLAALETALRAGYLSPVGVLRVSASVMLTALAWAAVVYGVMAVVDYAHQHYEFTKEQRMSIDDLRQEYKNAEGDPQNLWRRKAAYREAIYAGLTDRVQAASAVLYSTQVAVALQYLGPQDLPRVIARGEGDAAVYIRRLALNALVPTEFEPNLARRVYDNAQQDQPIPRAFYEPIARLLRWAEGR